MSCGAKSPLSAASKGLREGFACGSSKRAERRPAPHVQRRCSLTDKRGKAQDMQSRSKVWTQPVALFLAVGLSAAGAAASAAISETDPGSEKLEIGDSQPGNYLSALDRQRGSGHSGGGSLLPGSPPSRSSKSRSARARVRRRALQWRRTERRRARANGSSCATRAIAWRAFPSRFTISNKDNSPPRELTWRAGKPSRARDVTTALLTAWSYAGQSDLHHALDTLDRIRDPSVLAFRDYHAGLIANLLGNSAEAQRRLKSAYDNDKNSLRFADAYARAVGRAGRCGRSDESIRGFLGRHSPSSADRASACGPEGESSLSIRSFMTRRRAPRRRSMAWAAQGAARETNFRRSSIFDCRFTFDRRTI